MAWESGRLWSDGLQPSRTWRRPHTLVPSWPHEHRNISREPHVSTKFTDVTKEQGFESPKIFFLF